MAALKCDICGGNLMMGAGGIATCDSCGMKHSTDRMKEKVQEIKGDVTVSNIADITSLMERGWLLLEDTKYQQADEYFDKALDIDPKHAPAYVGKLCAELEIKSEADLGESIFIEKMVGYSKKQAIKEGAILNGRVIMISHDVTAYVELAPDISGQIHIDKLITPHYGFKVGDILREDDIILVKVIKIMDDKQGTILLSRKDALEEEDSAKVPTFIVSSNFEKALRFADEEYRAKLEIAKEHSAEQLQRIAEEARQIRAAERERQMEKHLSDLSARYHTILKDANDLKIIAKTIVDGNDPALYGNIIAQIVSLERLRLKYEHKIEEYPPRLQARVRKLMETDERLTPERHEALNEKAWAWHNSLHRSDRDGLLHGTFGYPGIHKYSSTLFIKILAMRILAEVENSNPYHYKQYLENPEVERVREWEEKCRQEQADRFQQEGQCRHCGGRLKGIFGKKCTACGKAS